MTFTANGKRQKWNFCPSLFSFVYSGVKLFVFAMDSRRRYSIFVCLIYGLEKKNSKSEVNFAVCRLPSAVNVMLSLSINWDLPTTDKGRTANRQSTEIQLTNDMNEFYRNCGQRILWNVHFLEQKHMEQKPRLDSQVVSVDSTKSTFPLTICSCFCCRWWGSWFSIKPSTDLVNMFSVLTCQVILIY